MRCLSGKSARGVKTETYLPGMLSALDDRPMFPPFLRFAFLIGLTVSDIKTNDVSSFSSPTNADHSHDVWEVFRHLLHERINVQPVMERVVKGAVVNGREVPCTYRRIWVAGESSLRQP